MMKRELLGDDPSSSDSESEPEVEIKVNSEYAQRFEHNKKREELARLEEKHGKQSKKRKRGVEDEESRSEESSSSEDEDEEAEFATEALDGEILATLNAIKSKDPRVYDKDAKFYTEVENATNGTKGDQESRKEKPIYLRDYHRQNLLNGAHTANETEENADVPISYQQEQDALRRTVISGLNAAAQESEDDSDEDMLVKKPKEKQTKIPTLTIGDVQSADRDPETFLSNFMSSRAWLPTNGSQQHAFDSDDSEEEQRAEQFEEAYNMRFEDPSKSNEVLRSYARDNAAAKSVRREDQNPRQKRRDAEKAAREAKKEEEREERSRLKRLRIEQVQEKVRRIRRAAGLDANDIRPEDWQRFIDDDWDDKDWEEEMQRRFGDEYYAEQDAANSSDEEAENTDRAGKKRKAKKPKFEDEIDINDLVPDFVDDEQEEAANFSLTEDEEEDVSSKRDASTKSSKKKSSKQIKQEKQRDSKKERRIIESLVEDQMRMEMDHALPKKSREKSAGFRYRATSPQSFGLSSRDILLADDAALNQFVGIKKLASFRALDKKSKDQKRLGKKARLRKWRLDTFGDENGVEEAALRPAVQIAPNSAAQKGAMTSDQEDGGVSIIDGEKKKKRRRKRNKVDGAAVEA